MSAILERIETKAGWKVELAGTKPLNFRENTIVSGMLFAVIWRIHTDFKPYERTNETIDELSLPL